jgi:hypothetical protein
MVHRCFAVGPAVRRRCSRSSFAKIGGAGTWTALVLAEPKLFRLGVNSVAKRTWAHRGVEKEARGLLFFLYGRMRPTGANNATLTNLGQSQICGPVAYAGLALTSRLLPGARATGRLFLFTALPVATRPAKLQIYRQFSDNLTRQPRRRSSLLRSGRSTRPATRPFEPESSSRSHAPPYPGARLREIKAEYGRLFQT